MGREIARRLAQEGTRISLMPLCTGMESVYPPGRSGTGSFLRNGYLTGCAAKGPEMTGPGWLDGIFAALMMLVALCCAGRIAIGRLRDRATELDADGLHVLMGVAMAGMFQPQLNPLPGFVWRAVFVAALRGSPGGHSESAAGPCSRCAHPGTPRGGMRGDGSTCCCPWAAPRRQGWRCPA